MKYHQIQFTIKKSGEIIEEVLGSSEDNSCLSVTKPFENALGEVEDREMKNQENYLTVENSTDNQQYLG